MNVSAIMNVTTMQRYSCYADIPINVFGNWNAIMVQRHSCHADITMDVFYNIHAFMVQLGTSCSFDSPGLSRNEPTPGKRLQGDATP